ncbi:PEPxxWA-CTERM sorting domain-containing protein [Sandaracinobacter sp. RS1-74]|uniref:PEPxxWA-CTERM sorting domain-containing protein n=1 Tax=Sandaracinobacteroides sayramensis TaxID=2913411 RepID=UPI001EDA0A30|nr:PEPxxWA-CTERM sorting domain-containing protein [Sandaracinobacteroides sayramensis]MCG2842181.1 PEPxxWA-CTERM sorting domain-containing protein [Sandaracinobacteroides sayramensis]
MNRIIAAALLSTAAIASSPAAAATLLGSEVTASLRYPTLETIWSQSGPLVVGADIEFPQGSLNSPNFQIDVTDTQVIFEALTSATYGNAPFNGFLLAFSGASPIKGVTVNAASTLAPVSFGFSAESIHFDVAGLVGSRGARIILDVAGTTSVDPTPGGVPEPATWAMLIAGFGFVGGALRRRKPAQIIA